MQDEKKFPTWGWVVLGSVLVFAVLSISNLKLEKKRETKYDKVKPISHLPDSIDNMVYNMGDSSLLAARARYDELVADYHYAWQELQKAETFKAFTYNAKEFNKYFVYPKFAEQIGVKYLIEYNRYIKGFINDTLTPLYVDVYKNKVAPLGYPKEK